MRQMAYGTLLASLMALTGCQSAFETASGGSAREVYDLAFEKYSSAEDLANSVSSSVPSEEVFSAIQQDSLQAEDLAGWARELAAQELDGLLRQVSSNPDGADSELQAQIDEIRALGEDCEQLKESARVMMDRVVNMIASVDRDVQTEIGDQDEAAERSTASSEQGMTTTEGGTTQVDLMEFENTTGGVGGDGDEDCAPMVLRFSSSQSNSSSTGTSSQFSIMNF